MESFSLNLFKMAVIDMKVWAGETKEYNSAEHLPISSEMFVRKSVEQIRYHWKQFYVIVNKYNQLIRKNRLGSVTAFDKSETFTKLVLQGLVFKYMHILDSQYGFYTPIFPIRNDTFWKLEMRTLLNHEKIL